MGNFLDATQVRAYREDGFYCPVDVLSSAEAKDYRKRFEAYEAANGGWYTLSKGQKLYLLQTWLAELACNENVLDAVESVLGPNILVWGSSLFIKDPGEGTYVSWHQDATYWGLSKPEVTTAWIALSPSTELSGCMKMVPGSHKLNQLEHRDTLDEKNLLTRGQEIAVDVSQGDGRLVELQPGQMSLHDVQIVHASDPNRSDDRRIGIAIRYITPAVSQINAKNDSAWLVRGQDTHGHFIHETPPKADMDPQALAEHARIMNIRQDVLYKGVDGKPAHRDVT